ncbi:MAG TPA: glycoside hydrolase family 2 TIM barrel-domain containing protein, partial [Blastocatellia bacterium]|nr:glycoside hydrolase family 2 TIM barrel-domain containing protein [Blastocatellia bacterium]
LSVPGDWNSQSEKLFLYEGTVWYKKDFDYQKKPGTRLFLYFGAANYDAIVYLNGNKLGEHVGGFTPFNFEITGEVHEGSNFVIVKVDNKRLSDGVPTLNSDWWNYGGLTRGVMLVEVPETFIQDYFVQLRKGSTTRIAGWVKLNGGIPRQRLTIRIPEANVSATFMTDDKGFAEIGLDANVKLWAPEDPKLYDVIISSESDSVTDLIGFRDIETRGGDIILNGKPIFLRGIDVHAEAPYRSGRAYSEDDARTLLGWAKELGCNFVRLAHYPHDETMTRMADRLGILVWSEIPVYWTIMWENPSTYENARNQLEESITRDKNRASIILWSLANETPLSGPRLTFLRKLTEEARRLDPTRLLTAALECHYINPSTEMIDDPLGQYLDVLGCNEYIGWYDGLPEKCDKVEWKTVYNKPVVISELGGAAVAGLHGNEMTRFTEEYQANLYEHQVGMLKRIPFLRGVSPWILMDFRSPRRPLAGIQDFYNRKGLISDRGQKKQAFFTLQSFYRDLSRR